MFLKEQLLSRIKQWETFNIWEESYQNTCFEKDSASLLKWYNAAWELARNLNPEWGRDLSEEKILRLQKTRNILSMLREINKIPSNIVSKR
ncbi:hypothetical protein Psch_02111 [Pelotomaculum schinkii]|uniref:Uncharacterized protein n=1 Tax=Pelotomaculum schinkii TaxID=78350 RepID=A0A4Y7RJP0_9FIRM|nr:hypothetical protein Psch_02111 [Pelotomaculum schinkii]